MADFNSKYTGQQVEDLLDQVANGNAGGSIPEDINNLKPLITDFSIADIMAYVEYGTNFNYNRDSIINALQNKQPIYIPYENDGLEGYYAAYGFVDDYIYLEVLCGEFLYYIELDYQGGGGIANIDVRNLDDFATEDDLSSAIETYIADFTMESLRGGMINGSHVNCDMPALVAAMNANKIILVRDGADSAYKGVYVLNGYAEDLLYFSIVDTAGNVLYCDGTDYVYVKSFINGQALFYRSWDDKQDQLQSGVSIKTINGESILGSGDIAISGGGSSSGSGKEYIVVEPDLSPAGSEAYIDDIVPNKTYIVSEPVSLLSFNQFSVSDALSDEYNVIFKADIGETTLSIPSYNSIYWANGVIPTIEAGAVYELSIQRVRLGAQDFFNAVLTSFKLIE